MEGKRQEIVELYMTSKADVGKVVDSLILKLKTYLVGNKNDREMRYMLLKLETVQLSCLQDSHQACVDKIRPMFEDLLVCPNITYLEMTFLSRLIEVSPTYDMMLQCEKLVLDQVETKYRDHKKYVSIKFSLSVNILARLIKAKYPSLNAMATEGDRNKIDALFTHHLAFAREVAERNNLDDWLALLNMREGIFYLKPKLVDKGITWLRDKGLDGLFPTALDELIKYYPYFEDDLTSTMLNLMTGYWVRKAMEAKKITVESVAHCIGLGEATTHKNLNGLGFKQVHLHKLAKMFDVDANVLTYGPAHLHPNLGDEWDQMLAQLTNTYRGRNIKGKEKLMSLLKAVVD